MLYSWIKKQAMKYEKCYIRDKESVISFKELFALAEELGTNLFMGKYGIYFDNELNSAIAVLACMYAKKTIVMLTKNYGEQHSANIIDSMKIYALITDKGIVEISPPIKEDLSDVAIILCTSGTTGKPKGAMLTETGIKVNLADFSSVCKIKPGNTFIITRPMFHCSVIICEFLFSLINGINIVFCSGKFDPFAIGTAIAEYNVSTIGGTPSTLYQISRFVGKMGVAHNIKNIICSGECMTQSVYAALRHWFSECNIYHAYGMTEASPRICCLPPELFDTHYKYVGYPMKSIKYKIVNGELLISGDNLFKGYYGQDERKTKWFHTGDAASVKDGMLCIYGRKDDMIIRHGINIYPAQIENIVKQHEEITETCAVGIRDDTVSEKILLIIESSSLSNESAYKVCLQLLPTYLMPDKIKVVPQISRTPSGKIQRHCYDMF